jgi:hypothetical protein
VRELAIVTESRSATRGHNYAIIGSPVLHKTTDPEKLRQRKAMVFPEPALTVDEARKLHPSKVE